jgi:hypothetical protein
MNDEVKTPRSDDHERLLEAMESVKRHLRLLIVFVSLMTLALILTVSAVFGNLVNYFSGDVMMWGGATAGAAVLGFLFGWFARRKV